MKRIWAVLAVIFLPLISCDNVFQTLSDKPDSQYLVVIGGEGGCVVNFVSPECDIEANPKTLVVWSPAKSTGSLPEKPVREGYTFTSWNTKEDGKGTEFTSNTDVPTDISVYAQWKINTYTVTFDPGGAAGAVPRAVSADAFSVITLPDKGGLAKAGHEFGGWNVSPSGEGINYGVNSPYTVTDNVTLYAKWNPVGTNINTVVFESNGGRRIPDQAVNSGSPALVPVPPPVKKGYKFSGWFADQGFGNEYDFSTPVTEDITLYAKWTIEQYTVTFDSNGAAGAVPGAVSAEAFSVITLPGKGGLDKTGYEFGGWNDNPYGTGINYSAGAEYIPDGNITLYAKWNIPAIVYTVAFDSEGGSAVASQTVISGESAFRPADPYLAKYSFSGWFSDPDFGDEYDFSTPVTEDITLYAKWTIEQYTVTFDSNGAAGNIPGDVSAEAGESITLPGQGDIAKTGYSFAGWNTNSSGSGVNYNEGAEYIPDGNTILYANWKAHVYKIVYNKNADDAAGTMEDSEHVYGIYKPLNPNVFTRSGGYVVAEWNTKANGSGTSYQNNESVRNLSENDGDEVVLYAQWKSIVSHTVSFHINGGSGVVPESKIVIDGEDVILPNGDELTKEGYVFNGWNTNDAGTGTNYPAGSYYIPSGNITLYAKWSTETYTVTFNAEGGTPVPPAQILNYGGIVTRPPDPARIGYTFNGWYGDSMPGVAYDFSSPVTEDITIYAGWTPITYTVAYNANDGSGNMTNSSHTYDVPQSLSPNQFTRTGYTFAGWNTAQGGSGTGYGNNQSVSNLSSVNGDTVTLYAQWTRISYNVTFYTNGGTPVPENQTINEGEKVAQPTDPVREGYTFVFWYNKSKDLKYNFNTPVTEDLSLYALWE